MKLKALQPRRLLQGLIKQHEIEFSCDISTGQSDIAFSSLNNSLNYIFFQGKCVEISLENLYADIHGA